MQRGRSGKVRGSLSSPTCWPRRLAIRDASDRPQGTPAHRYAAAVHRYRWARFTAFATDAKPGWFTDLELGYRGRPTCGDRIGNAKDTGLRNLPLHGFD
jgi:hypothetical protein